MVCFICFVLVYCYPRFSQILTFGTYLSHPACHGSVDCRTYPIPTCSCRVPCVACFAFCYSVYLTCYVQLPHAHLCRSLSNQHHRPTFLLPNQSPNLLQGDRSCLSQPIAATTSLTHYRLATHPRPVGGSVTGYAVPRPRIIHQRCPWSRYNPLGTSSLTSSATLLLLRPWCYYPC